MALPIMATRTMAVALHACAAYGDDGCGDGKEPAPLADQMPPVAAPPRDCIGQGC